ncbi:hypothetical protein C9374_013673 [Naegleria lovaniensis]|uniref:Uncharacterized protein n=1 Tax=Naegleria lovaniensis TaxID=51637 RepID=A0AA88KAX3_NAELO|nr:uncharacterized protein C9374_013673 [Naegleria lovaniensis]KAG2372665.1 hypothetical protein C9374_013673 [Naegleria lovaniensis]
MISKIKNFFSSPSRTNESDQQSDMDRVGSAASSKSGSKNKNNNDRMYRPIHATKHQQQQQPYHIYLPSSILSTTTTTSREFHVMKTNTYYGHSSSQLNTDPEGFIKRSCFHSVKLPQDFRNIAQILCVSHRIYVLEAGSGRVHVYDIDNNSSSFVTPVGYMMKFDGERLKVVAIRGDTYGMLYLVYDSTLNRCVLYGGDQNHYDNVGVDVPKHSKNLDCALAFDPYWDQSGGIVNREITHVECAYSLSFCVTNHCEIRISGQVIWCRPGNTSTTWKEIVFTTRRPIIDLQTHSFGFVALLDDSTICVGGSNNHYENMHSATGSYIDIQYIDNLNYVPKQIYCTSYTTIVRTSEDKFIEYGRGFANRSTQTPPNGTPFVIDSTAAPNYSKQFESNYVLDEIYLKGSMIASSYEKPDLYFLYSEGGVNGFVKLSDYFDHSLVMNHRVRGACNTSCFVLYVTYPDTSATFTHMHKKLFEILWREDAPLSDVHIVVSDHHYARSESTYSREEESNDCDE